MIEPVSFTNFKSQRRVDAELGRFTVIVGPNGSGKTSILDGLHYLLAGNVDVDLSNLKSRGGEPRSDRSGTARSW